MSDAQLPDDFDAALGAMWRGDTAALERLMEGSDSRRQELLAALRSAELAPSPLLLGMSFDGLEVEGRIGQGGMGSVHAVRELSTGRRLALKVSQHRLQDPSAEVQRVLWAGEIRALSRLQHPNIASLHRVGETPLGNPYLLLERVDGERLDRCRAAVEEDEAGILQLVDQVCDAISFAHRRGVLHLDLKPSNVLVDREGQVKVLDFGMARLNAQDAQEESHASIPRAMVGTLPYLAPEQVEGDKRSIDTRTDVYAIGVILYRLLTGAMPFAEWSGQPVQLAERIRSGRFPAPGARRPGLDPDLQEIIAKAMAASSDLRYESVLELRRDLDRYRCGHPVQARPLRAWQRLLRLARLHRRVASVACAAALLLALAWAGTAVALIRAQQSERLARTNYERAEEGREYIESVLALARPETGGSVDEKVIELLRRAGARVQEDTQGAPWLESVARQALARAFLGRGHPGAAIPHLDRALELRRELVAATGDGLEVAEAHRDLGFALHADSQLDAALPHLQAAMRMRMERLPASDPAVLQSVEELASLHLARGDGELGRRHLTDLVEALRGQAPPAVLADALTRLGQYECDGSWNHDALLHLQEALALLEDGDQVTRLAARRQLFRLRIALREPGVIEEGEALRAEQLAVLGPATIEEITTLQYLAHARSVWSGDLEAAETMREANLLAEQKLGPHHARTLMLEGQYYAFLCETPRWREGLDGLRRHLEKLETALGAHHRDIFKAGVRLARRYASHARLAELDALIPRLDALRARHPAVDRHTTLSYLHLRGRHAERTDPEAAEAFFRMALHEARRNTDATALQRLDAERVWAAYLQRTTRPVEALAALRATRERADLAAAWGARHWLLEIKCLVDLDQADAAQRIVTERFPEQERSELPESTRAWLRAWECRSRAAPASLR